LDIYAGDGIHAYEKRIHSLPYEWCFWDFPIRAVYLNNNALTVFPAALVRLPLTTLNLSHNKIAHLPKEIGRLRSLTKLDISFNQIPEIPDTIGNLSKLQELHLNHNKLTTLPASLCKLENLRHCPLEVNLLTHVPAVLKIDGSSIANLIFFDIRGVRVESDEEARPETPADPKREAAFDLLSFFHAVARSNRPTLPEAANLLCKIRGDIFSQQKAVQAWMRQNPEPLATVQLLTCSSVTFAQFPREIFQLRDLRYLHMSFCNLTELPDEIGTLSKLETLSLEGNSISRLPVTLNNLSSLVYLWLGDNPIKSVPYALAHSPIEAISRNDLIKAARVEEPPAEPTLCEKLVAIGSSLWNCVISIFNRIVQCMRS
jgi:Leucine-rich repeat (LRR) protein